MTVLPAPLRGLRSRNRRADNKRTFLMSVIIIVTGTFLIYPIGILLVLSFNTAKDILVGPSHWGFANWVHAWAYPGLGLSLWHSFIVWLLCTVIGLPLGMGIAFILARTNIKFSQGFEFLFWAAFIFPVLSSVLGWEMLLSPGWGFLNRALEVLPFIHAPGPFNIYSVPGIVFTKLVSGGSGISFYVILLTPAFRNMDGALEEASRISGASNIKTMLKITFPVMISAIVLVLALQLINVFAGFEIEYLLGSQFGFYVFSTLIYQLVNGSVIPMYAQAIVLASTTLLVIAMIIPFQNWILHRKTYTTVTGSFQPGVINLRRWRAVATIAVSLFLFMVTALPALTIIAGSFMTRVGFFDAHPVYTFGHWIEVFTNTQFFQALETTLILGVFSAFVGSMMFAVVAYIIVRTRWRGRSVLDSMIWGSSAMPGILLGLGLLLMFLMTPGLKPLFGSIWPLLIVVTLASATTGVNILKGVLIQLGPEMEEAGRVSGAGWARTYFSIVMPIMLPSMVLVGMLNFVSATAATSSIILLASYKATALSILGLNYASSGGGGRLEDAGIVSLLLMALSLGIALPARLYARRRGIDHGMKATQ